MAEKELQLVAEKILEQDEAIGSAKMHEPPSPEDVENVFKNLNNPDMDTISVSDSVAESDSHFSTTSTDTASTVTSTAVIVPVETSPVSEYPDVSKSDNFSDMEPVDTEKSEPDDIPPVDRYDNFACVSSSTDSGEMKKSIPDDYDLFGQTHNSPKCERRSVTFRDEVEEKVISDRKCYHNSLTII